MNSGAVRSPRPGSLPRLRRGAHRLTFAVAGLALVLLLPGTARAVALPAQDTLRVVFSTDKLSAVNRSDALASFKAWIETVGRRRSINILVQAESYASTEELRRILRSRSADLLIIRGLQYLELGKDRALLDPLFMPEVQGTVHQKYYLLTRRDQRLSLAGLRGKRILHVNSLTSSLSRYWLDGLLRQRGLGTLERFAPGSEDVGKPSAAILPVYFGKADACVADSAGFHVMRELNPQLGQALEVCQVSPSYLESVICVRRDYTGHRADLIDGLARLHEEVAGRQILMVFKVDRLVPFEDRQLNTVRELRAATVRDAGVAAR